jgi:integrase
MATIKFLLKGKNNPSTIYVRFVVGNNTADIWRSTGYAIDPKQWESKKGKPKQSDAYLKKLTTDLNDLQNAILRAFNNTPIDEIDGNWLKYQIQLSKGVIKPEQTRSDLLIECIQYMIDSANTRENSKGGLGLSKSRINSYKNLLKIFGKYQGSNKYRVKDVDIRFGRDFLAWMLNKQNYSESYARKKVDDLKTVCVDAEIYGIQTSGQIRKIKGGKPKNDYIIYLTHKELDKIETTNLISTAHQNARKWLLLGCNIGQRGGDLLKLTKDNFIQRNGLEVIELKQQKTNKQVTIPILEKTREIIKEGLPYPIAQQNFNKSIKEICKLAEINEIIEGRKFDGEKKRKVTDNYEKWELITSHVCRRSFATNLYGVLPTPLIMQVTAHSTEKMFLGYIGKGSLDYAQQIADFYELQKQKEGREPELKVIKSKSN